MSEDIKPYNNGYQNPGYKHLKELVLLEGILTGIKVEGSSSRLTILLNNNSTEIIKLDALVSFDALDKKVSISGYERNGTKVYRSLTYRKKVETTENVSFNAP